MSLTLCLIYKLNFISGTDAQGKTVHTGFVLPMDSGIHWVSWDRSAAEKGIYNCDLERYQDFRASLDTV